MKTQDEPQRRVCQKFGADFLQSDDTLKIGISRAFDPQRIPINGLRHPPEGDTTGWFIWSGEEFSDAPDFFVPWRIEEFLDRYPEIGMFLGLAPGWRFLIAPDYEDVWFDDNLLNV